MSAGAAQYFTGLINDVRYYDNCLTDEEIKKIAQGLMLHIPLTGAPAASLYTNASGLPTEYQEVEYLETTGTQNIQNIIINQNDTVYFKAQTASDITSEQGIIGSEASSKFEFYVKTNNIRAWSGCAFINPWTTTPVTTYQDFTVKGTITLADGSAINLFSYATSRLFFKGKIYFLKFYTSAGTQKYNFVPCYRKSDNKPGMYETVTKTFYVNNGSGEFICGPVKKSLPNTYIPLDYIQSSGTQWIDTGITYNGNIISQINLKFEVISKSTNTWPYIFGAWSADSANTCRCLINTATDQIGGKINGNAPTNEYLVQYKLNTPYEYIQKTNSFVINGTTQSLTLTTGSTYCNKNIFLFTRSDTSSTAGSTGNTSKIRLYYCNIYNNNNILVRQFIPVLRISDSKPGMYDLVNDVFYANGGSGEFTYNSNTIEYDISGFKNDMTILKNNVLLGNKTNNPRYNISANFKDTSSDYMYHNGQFAGNDKIFTISGWVYFTDFTGDNIPFACNLASGGGNSLCNIYFYRNNSVIWCACSSSNVTTPTTWEAATWHMLTITCDGTTAKIYLDGGYIASTTPGSSTPNVNFAIGNRSGASTGESGYSSYFMNGKISDVRMYATCLSANDVAELYNMGRLS